MKKSSILQIKPAPYQPATKGCPERLVRTFKNSFRKMERLGCLNKKLNIFLFTYIIKPQSSTGILLA